MEVGIGLPTTIPGVTGEQALGILIAPNRANGALLAKQAATLDHLSGGRLVLGVAVGGREDDYKVSGVDFHRRGGIFDEMLAQWEHLWAGEPVDGGGVVGPQPPRGRPTLIIGGTADVAFERAARYALGDGAKDAANSYLRDYYAFLGEDAGMVADGAATDADTVKGYVQGFAEASCDELILFPCSTDPGQVDLLADAIA
jgi:alkanesulfonate monooxygenase SsuD/methylene tetrahydromethanopterin reductase-like flavin-dependent oxidoreductase (luciferase family)